MFVSVCHETCAFLPKTIEEKKKEKEEERMREREKI